MNQTKMLHTQMRGDQLHLYTRCSLMLSHTVLHCDQKDMPLSYLWWMQRELFKRSFLPRCLCRYI